jgi:flagellar hook protein FlgE
MIQAFYTGINGMQTSSSGIDIVSDNLANVSTNGYRASGYEFSSLFEDAVVTSHSTSSNSVGLGTRLQATPTILSSGSYATTDRSTDLAISGDGWFGVEGNGGVSYTRDGAFGFDANDTLVTADGFSVLGTMGGNISGDKLTANLDTVPLGAVNSQEPLTFPNTLTYPSEPTTSASFSGNIGTENDTYKMSVGIVDAEGNRNELVLDYTRSDPQNPPGSQWDVVATTQSLDGTTVYDTQKGRVEFDSSGALTSNTLTSINNNGSQVSIDLGSGYTGVVSLSNVATYASSSADGIIAGDLSGYDVNMNGEVIAAFTNGQQSSVGKVAVYHFQNDQGLDRLSGTRFSQSSNSGDAFFYQDENGQNITGSRITNHTLETSNVDMTNGLTELIVLQRSYDSNSKSFTTADEMMQKALEMDA